MSKKSPPKPNLRQWPPLEHIVPYILILLVYIPVSILLLATTFLGPGISDQLIEIAISSQSIILSICMLVPFVFHLVSGYLSNDIRVPNQQEEDWAAGLESAFENFAQTARFPFPYADTRHPDPMRTEKIVKYAKKEFVQYLANPYHKDPFCASYFSRRNCIFLLVTGPWLALSYASMPFIDWDTEYKGWDAFMQGLGCFLVIFWCHVFWEPMWKVGWALKMGAIARQIRRECRKNGSVKGSEEDVEKFGARVSPKEKLEWRI